MRYYFTNHAIQRFRERFRHKIVNNDLTKSLQTELAAAKPDNSIRNNTAFIVGLHEAHGWKAFQFLVSDEIVFICRDNKLVTLYPKRYSRFDSTSSRFTS